MNIKYHNIFLFELMYGAELMVTTLDALKNTQNQMSSVILLRMNAIKLS